MFSLYPDMPACRDLLADFIVCDAIQDANPEYYGKYYAPNDPYGWAFVSRKVIHERTN